MTRCVLLMLSVAVLAAGAPKDDSTDKDSKKLEGTWVLASVGFDRYVTRRVGFDRRGVRPWNCK